MKIEKNILTYGTFDMFHEGHVNVFKHAKALGSRLIVGVSTDEFNMQKGKQSLFSFSERSAIVQSCRYVDKVIPETCWDQKVLDIDTHNIQVFVMGDDWQGEFDFLSAYCEVKYIPRTPCISSTHYRQRFFRQFA